jgi:hypothetical protein
MGVVTGVPPQAGSGHSPSGLSQSSLSQAQPSVPNAFAELAAKCEAATKPSFALFAEAFEAAYGARSSLGQKWSEFCTFVDDEAWFDAALMLLEPKHDWRRLTPTSISVYAGNPYNAAAQTRYDGYGATLALQLCAAFLKMRAAIEAKAIATEARRAETENTGSVHEGAGPQDIAQ